jgi:hypothetical protein
VAIVVKRCREGEVLVSRSRRGRNVRQGTYTTVESGQWRKV